MGVSVEWRREMIDASSSGHHVPDENWRYTDSFGHVHAFDGNDLPTLEWVVTGTYWCSECRDEHEEGEWRCRICGEVVEPHYNFTGPQHLTIPGLLEVTLTVDGRTFYLAPAEAESLHGLEGIELEDRAREIAAMREP